MSAPPFMIKRKVKTMAEARKTENIDQPVEVEDFYSILLAELFDATCVEVIFHQPTPEEAAR